MFLYTTYALMLLHTFVGVILIAVILLQRGRGGGLAGAFGGLGGQSALGTRAGDLFTKITIGLATFWIGLGGVCVLMASNVGTSQYNNANPVIKKADEEVGTKSDLDKADIEKTDEEKSPVKEGEALPTDPPKTDEKSEEKKDEKTEETPAPAGAKPAEDGKKVDKAGEKLEKSDEEVKAPEKPAPEKPAATPEEPAKKPEEDTPKDSADKKPE